LLFHLLDPNIDATTVDLVPKTHVARSLRWHQVCSFLFIEITFIPWAWGCVTLRLTKAQEQMPRDKSRTQNQKAQKQHLIHNK